LPRIIEWAHELDVDEVNVSHLMVFTKDLKGSSLLGHRELSNRCLAAAAVRARELGVFLTAPAPFDSEVDPAAEADLGVTSGETTEDGLGTMRPRQDIPTPALTSEVAPPQVSLLAHESAAPHWAPERYWCKFAWREVFIGISGDVAPCCHQNRPVVGNVFRDDWDAIWNGLEYQELRAGLFDKKPRPYCASCSLLAEQGLVDYQDETYLFEDRYPDQTRADVRPPRPKRGD
ncbi:MAG: SPASM domain-containing protein, partial [Planctomycetes bacterium]|nr:SPASM domain-containing protein [Planctomycetota bacterium]